MCFLNNGHSSVKIYFVFERYIVVIGWSYYTNSSVYVEAFYMNNNVCMHFMRVYKFCISKQQPSIILFTIQY
jgi:hypothetical protein